MSDKQRADHVQAKYWNGFVTRTEAQKVFDDYAKVLNAQGVVLQKMDAVLSFYAEKFGVTQADIEDWVKSKIEKAQEAQPEEPKRIIAEA